MRTVSLRAGLLASLALVCWSVPAQAAESSESLCSDGLDNDEDGLADCADVDCVLFEHCASGQQMPADDTAAPEDGQKQKGPTRPWGIGVYYAPTFMLTGDMLRSVSAYSQELDELEFGVYTGGLGLFGEYALTPFLALGLEAFLTFPAITAMKLEGEDYFRWCTDCEMDYLFSTLVRVKLVIPAHPMVTPYGLLAPGFNLYSWSGKNTKARHYKGLTGVAGLGLDVHPLGWLTVFFEVRAQLGIGWETVTVSGNEKLDRLRSFGIVLTLGVSVP